MNKKILAVSLCIVMLVTIPIAAGTSTLIQKEKSSPDEPQGYLGKTFVRGFILGYHTRGLMTSFYAVFCHYKTFHLFREPESGYYMLHHVQFLGKIHGRISMFYIYGMFYGTPF